ncbi:MAG TPA: hypothetical protein VMV46_16130 [Thermoanaerobaculia bacterium]|nr:hypothetical protein [Thermoanaerobaculia bacterium]
MPAPLDAAWRAARERWRALDGTARLWRRDASLFTGGDEHRWLGWLDLPDRPLDPQLAELQRAVAEQGVRRVVLLGMGGSSLGAEALAANLATGDAPAFTVIDTTEPEAVAAALAALDAEPTLVIAASKSGGTLETDLLLRAFSARASPERVAVVTDPGSALERQAREQGYRWSFAGDPEVGGRFSVLSAFGLAPAAALGLPVAGLLAGAREAAAGCRQADPELNPGVALGTLLAAAVDRGRDLLTVLAGASGPAAFADWLEQLVAESLGKGGTGVLPVIGEEPDLARRAASQRIYLALAPRAPATADLEGSDEPVVAGDVAGARALGFELFRWEVATAVAGSLLGVHPFDQPDVESAKAATRAWIERAARGEELAWGAPVARAPGIAAFAPREAGEGAAAEGSIALAVERFLAGASPGEPCALLAFLPASPPVRAALARLRRELAVRFGVVTTLGLGPRYLHSTGQLHKGGPERGRYLVFSRAAAAVPAGARVPVPGLPLSFAEVHAAQALGDFEALAARGRRVLRLELEDDPADSLTRLAAGLAACS